MMANSNSTAPVHKKFVNKINCDTTNNNHFLINNRFISNNNNNSTHFGHNHNNNYSKSLSLNRHSEVTSTLGGVGSISGGTLTSPYAYTGSGFNANGRGTKSDIGVSINRQMMKRSMAKSQCHKSYSIGKDLNSNSIIHKSKSRNLLPSVHTDLYDVHDHPKIPEIDFLNNNYSLRNKNLMQMNNKSALMSPSSESNFEFTNKHRFNNFDNPLFASSVGSNNNSGNDKINVSHQGPLVYKNDIDDDLARCDWSNSVFDNPIMTVSQKLPTTSFSYS